MADPVSYARTNWFRVKDEESFRAWAAEISGVRVVCTEGYFALIAEDDGGGFPSAYFDEKTQEEYEFDIVAELSDRLAEDSVAVFVTVGHERMRSLWGFARAINSNGLEVSIDLDAIFVMAADELGPPDTVKGFHI